MLPPAKAVFLDRDGTLNVDYGYVVTARQWRFLPHVVPALQRLQGAGYRLVVVTNQSAIARGYASREQVDQLHAWVDQQLRQQGVQLAGWYLCPHHPHISGPCSCRKPKPGLLLQAAHELGLNLAASWMIGDKASDVEAGQAAGCRSLRLNGPGHFADLAAAVDWLLAQQEHPFCFRN